MLILLALIGSVLFIAIYNYYKKETPVYQGPVRPTDDEEYFRNTGITKPMEQYYGDVSRSS
jgi:hypothetical protein